jgi:hypothetical protein
MPLYTIPLAPHSSLPHSRTHLSSLPSRKRKRTPSLSPSPTPSSNDEGPPAATNPLSLTPAEIAQYKLAGLDLDQEVPGTGEDAFPHRALRDQGSPTRNRRKGKGKEAETEADGEYGNREKRRRERGKDGLRTQHLGVLTAILHKCLLGGDIQRASRAWAMLIRAQVSGHAIDLRGSGYWGIGAELLIRSLDAPPQPENLDGNADGDGVRRARETDSGRRWGTKEGLEKAKNFYEHLILQYPYKRQFHESVNALDFWPAMVGCEIYGVQWEEKDALRNVTEAEENVEESTSGSSSEYSEREGENPFAIEERKKTRKRERREQKYAQQRDLIRRTALVESEKIAARLDDLMTSPPYSDSHILLRLRGMLALYIGDLSVPSRPIEEDEDIEDQETLDNNHRLGLGGRDTERRILLRRRLIEFHRGKEKQSGDRSRARALFDRIRREGGKVGINMEPLEGEGNREDLYDTDE